MLDIIDERTDRLNRFIEGLVELARIESRRDAFARRWGVSRRDNYDGPGAGSPATRDHLVVVRLDDDLPAVRVDNRYVAEVVFTLVDNAAKYSPA